MKLLNYFKKATSYTSLIIVFFGLTTIATVIQNYTINSITSRIAQALAFVALVFGITSILGSIIMAGKILRELKNSPNTLPNKSFFKSVAKLCYVAPLLIWIFYIIMVALAFVISSSLVNLSNEATAYISLSIVIIAPFVVASNIALIVGFGMCNVCKHKLIDAQAQAQASSVTPATTPHVVYTTLDNASDPVTLAKTTTTTTNNQIDPSQPNAIGK